MPIVQVPNKLIISPHHIVSKQFGPHKTYKDVFDIAPELFDADFPVDPNYDIPSK